MPNPNHDDDHYGPMRWWEKVLFIFCFPMFLFMALAGYVLIKTSDLVMGFFEEGIDE